MIVSLCFLTKKKNIPEPTLAAHDELCVYVMSVNTLILVKGEVL